MARAATDDDLAGIDGTWTTPPDVARLITEHDRVVAI